MGTKYLEVPRNKPNDIDSLYHNNYKPLLTTLIRDLQKWSSKTFSWFGRASTLKMTILPRLLYLFNALPIKIPESFFTSLLRAQRRFLWADRKPRIKLNLLSLPKHKGGIGLPNFKKYQQASHITRIIDWHCHSSNKDWIQLEQSLFRFNLIFYPWSLHSKTDKKLNHPLVANTLDIWQKVAGIHKLASIPGPLTPVTKNPDFIPGLHIWCRCPPLHVFWEAVIKWTKFITETTLEFTAASCLINVNKLTISKYKKSLSRHLLLAAKTLIPLHCKTTHVPNIKDWLERVNYIYKMEEIAVMKKENSTNFNITWQPWLLFLYSPEYHSLTN